MQVEQLSINTLYHLDCLGLHCCEKKKLYIKLPWAQLANVAINIPYPQTCQCIYNHFSMTD